MAGVFLGLWIGEAYIGILRAKLPGESCKITDKSTDASNCGEGLDCVNDNCVVPEVDVEVETSKGTVATSSLPVCYLADACSKESKDKGQVGIILKKGTTFGGVGSPYTDGWNWAHPNLCCTNSVKTLTGTGCYLADKCPSGYIDKGLGGIIVKKGTKFGTVGSPLNEIWDWVHPSICCK